MRQRGYNKMSLCYEFEKWTMITSVLASATLATGLIMLMW
jgi:hypothetical protein